AVALLHHHPHHRLAAVQGAAEVDPDDAVPHLVILLEERAHGVPAGVVHEHVDPPEAVHDLCGHRIDALAVAHIHADGEGWAAELLGHGAGGLLVEVGDHHHGPLGGEAGGDAAADAARSAGDHADPPGEVVSGELGGVGGVGAVHGGAPGIGSRGHGAHSRGTLWRLMTSFMIWAVPSPICSPSTSRRRCSIGRSVR